MSALFDQHQDRVLDGLKAGLSTRDVAREAGVAERTVKGWLSRGRDDPDSKYGPFASEVDVARAEREIPATDRPLSTSELKVVASQAARKGNVSAMRLVWEMLTDDGGGKSADDSLAEVDELARRRSVRAG